MNNHFFIYWFRIINLKIYALLHWPAIYLNVFDPFVYFCLTFAFIFLSAIITFLDSKAKVFRYHTRRITLKHQTNSLRQIWTQQWKPCPSFKESYWLLWRPKISLRTLFYRMILILKPSFSFFLVPVNRHLSYGNI